MMGQRNERLLQKLLSQDHKKPLEELLELASTFKPAERKSFKRDDSDKKETDPNTVAATKQPGQTQHIKPHNQKPHTKSQ